MPNHRRPDPSSIGLIHLYSAPAYACCQNAMLHIIQIDQYHALYDEPPLLFPLLSACVGCVAGGDEGLQYVRSTIQ